MNHSFFRAGAARVDITPPLGTIINGDFVSHYAKTVHDPLFAKALVLKNRQTTLVIIVVDICVMPRDFLDRVKETITRQLEIPYANILISSTHTHAAGSVAEVHLVGADLGYRQKLPHLIVEAVREAHANLRPTEVAFGQVDVPEHVVCRRYLMDAGYQPLNPVTGSVDGVKTNPLGEENHILGRAAVPDPGLGFLGIREPGGKWLGLLANYSLHYVGDWENGTLSADYFGEFSEQIRQKLGADDAFVGVMSNGTSGDANIWDFIHPDRYPTGNFAKSRYIGADLAEKVFGEIENLVWDQSPALAAYFTELKIATNKPTESELAEAQRITANSDYERITPDEQGLPRIYAREQVLLSEFPEAIPCLVQAMKIGNTVIGALPGEFFAETGLRLKAQFSNYFSIGLANGNVGYVPPAAEIEQGGYETWRCRISCLESGAEQKFREALVGLVEKLIQEV